MQKRWNAALDCLMAVLLPAYSRIGEAIHEWLGIAMLLLSRHVFNFLPLRYPLSKAVIFKCWLFFFQREGSE